MQTDNRKKPCDTIEAYHQKLYKAKAGQSPIEYGGVILLGTLFFHKKYNKNIDDV